MRPASTDDPCVQSSAAHSRFWVSSRLQLAVLLLLALLHGAQYALLMPPWGLIDEIQHFDYVGQLVESGRFPVTGETLLAPDRVASLFATQHWMRFHWATPASSHIEHLGATGYSYEGYQPPMFYLLMAPVYLVAPADPLARLFVLRLAVVGLSLFSVYFCFRTACLFSRETGFAFLATLLFVSIPERTLAMSRLNNDVLLEVMGAALAYTVAAGVSYGYSTRRLQVAGLLLALGVLTKLSMLFWAVPVMASLWYARRSFPWRTGTWVVGPLIAATALIFARNLLIYQDLIGYGAFHALYVISAPSLTFFSVIESIGALFRSLWLIWWKGSAVASNLLVELLFGLLWLATLLSALQWFRLFAVAWRARRWDRSLQMAAVFGVAILVFATAILASYFRGMIPVVQGRFFAPVVVPVVILLAFGLWRYRHGDYLVAGVALLLGIGSLLLLWGNLLPYHYYWSESATWPGIHELSTAAQRFMLNLASDKPAFVTLLQPLAIFVFALTWMGFWIALGYLLKRRDVPENAPASY